MFSPVSTALVDEGNKDKRPLTILFVEFESYTFDENSANPSAPITIQGKLKIPAPDHHPKGRFVPKKRFPAVVILHGSSGVDFRGDFFARALNSAGIATLEIDMWEARGVTGVGDRPPLPLFTYPDVFAALSFLFRQPNIDPERIGVLGFSWGGVISMASAVEAYASDFGGGLRFAAHVAHYPVCYAYNSGFPGLDFHHLTGAPVLIQIGERDDYDEGSGPSFAVREALPPGERDLVEVKVYEGAFHGWDRLQVPVTVFDPFSHLGAGGEVRIAPNVDQAYASREKAVRFFLDHLCDKKVPPSPLG
jgi:dienelactone hydrolase